MSITAGRLSCCFAVALAALTVSAIGQESAPTTPAPPLPGSTRHAQVAIPMENGLQPLTILLGRLSEADVAALEESTPNVKILTGLSRKQALELAPTVHAIDATYCSPEFLRAATALRWVQAQSAGVDRYMKMPELRDESRIVFTNMQGIHGPTIADHVFGTLLALTRDLRPNLDPARRGEWNRRGSGAERIALRDRTLLVVGLGGIGREVARRGAGFGMRVHATRRSATPPPEYVDRQGGPDDLHELLAEADVVVLCVPLTKETNGMIGAEELALLKRGSYLVNIARGPVVDTDALVAALQSGHLAGACLDVTDPEPLPPDHVLWTMDNVIITPHVASISRLTEGSRRDLLLENIRRFGAGEPLLNVVDRKAGY